MPNVVFIHYFHNYKIIDAQCSSYFLVNKTRKSHAQKYYQFVYYSSYLKNTSKFKRIYKISGFLCLNETHAKIIIKKISYTVLKF